MILLRLGKNLFPFFYVNEQLHADLHPAPKSYQQQDCTWYQNFFDAIEDLCFKEFDLHFCCPGRYIHEHKTAAKFLILIFLPK